MKKFNAVIVFLTLLLLTSCFSGSLLTNPDSAFFNIVGVQMSLIKYLSQNARGCHEIETTEHYDENAQMGICFLYKTNKFLNENAAPFTEGGLVEKIKTIKVFIGNNTIKKEVTNYLIGEQKYQDLEINSDSIQYSNGFASEKGCSYKPYCKNLTEWQRIMNNGLERFKLEGYHPDTHFFWFTKAATKAINFKPTYLKMEMTFQDSLTQKIRIVQDSIIL